MGDHVLHGNPKRIEALYLYLVLQRWGKWYRRLHQLYVPLDDFGEDLYGNAEHIECLLCPECSAHLYNRAKVDLSADRAEKLLTLQSIVANTQRGHALNLSACPRCGL